LGKAYTYLRWQTTLLRVETQADAADFEEGLENGGAEPGVIAGHEETEMEAVVVVVAVEGGVGATARKASGCPARNWAAW